VSGNNGSAFFFRLHRRAKSAMAEILVSDLCDLSPALLIGGFFRYREERGHPGAFFLDLFPPVFLIVLHCFVSIVYFLAISTSFIVFLRIIAL
jgi:hypothetical protein